MIIDYGRYRYTDNINDGKYIDANSTDLRDRQLYEEHKYNDAQYSNWVNAEEYESAADYLSGYVFNTQKDRISHSNQIMNLQRRSNITKAYYSHIENNDDKLQIEAWNAIQKGNIAEAAKTNPYAEQYLNWKNNLGNVGENDDEKANALGITFQSRRQGINGSIAEDDNSFGAWFSDLFGLDNEYNTFDKFLERSNLSEEELKRNGVQIEKTKEGDVRIKFTKTNNLTDKILINGVYGGFQTKGGIIEGFNSIVDDKSLNYKNINSYAIKQQTGITYNSFDQENYIGTTGFGDYINRDNPTELMSSVVTSRANHAYYNTGLDLVNKLKDTKKKYDNPYVAGPRVHSAVISGPDDDFLRQLDMDHDAGTLDDDNYWKYRNDYVSKRQQQLISAIGSGEYEMFSNINNIDDNEKGFTDETLRYLDNDQRAMMINVISAIEDGKLPIHRMYCDGVYGTSVFIDANWFAKEGKDFIQGKTSGLKGETVVDKNMTNFAKKFNGRRVQVFIPYLNQEEAQKELENDTRYRSVSEIDDMQHYGYDYTTKSGSSIKVNGDGNFTKVNKDGTKELLDYNDACLEINKDYMIRYGTSMLVGNYLNSQGDFTNSEEDKLGGVKQYTTRAMIAAVRCSNELMRDTPLVDMYGKEIVIKSKQDLANALMNGENSLQYDVYNKLKHINDIYDAYMKELTKYGIFQ